MKTASYAELQRDLAGMIDGVVQDHEPVVITRGEGKPSAVLMSLEDFDSYEETRYLLQSPTNATRLIAAIKELDGGGGSEHSLIE